MSTKNNKNEFRTPDLYFAAYLQTAGVPMINAVREGGRVFFVFDTQIADIDELKTGWFNQTAKVPALPFSNSVKSLKSICHMP
jgi:hypothetical protein